MSTGTKRRKNVDRPTKLRIEGLNENISIADVDIEDLQYQPKSDRTLEAHGLILKFIAKKLGFQHDSILKGAADEVIGTMKDPNLDEQSRRADISRLLSQDEHLDDDEYNELCNFCKRIDDWDVNKDDPVEEKENLFSAALNEDVDDDDKSDDHSSEEQDDDDEWDKPLEFELEDVDENLLSLEKLAQKPMIVPRIDIGEPVRREGYHEYNVMPKKRQSYHQDDLLQIEDLSENEQKAFVGIKTLNYIQSRIYKRAIGSDKSLLICAPTGAGKTNIALLTMLREIMKYPHESTQKNGSRFDTSKFKIIYVAPIKALVQEVVENFSTKLSHPPFNLVVEELTGDHQLDQKQISRAQLIVCTPEKWDIVTRKSLDRLYTKLVRLVIFDEIHLLHNERGATLEALVARIKRHKYMEGDPIRIVGLSATLPNYKDVSRFISPDEPIEESTIYFDSSYRPIPLRQQYIALTESKKVFRLINDIVYEKVIERLADHSQILIFVHSRPDTFKTAEFIRTRACDEHKVQLFLTSEASVEKINDYGRDINPKLKELLQFGIGTHHAGMSKYERACVEDLFRSKYIRVLVSTATLAWGVNLPARTVIIKGTQVYREGKWTDLDSLDVTQMLGRAGRPGFDKEGEGIVITQQSKVAFYISLMTEQLPVESKLIGRLADFINAECVVGNIESLDSAVNWISETYLNSRMLSVLHQDDRQYMSLYGITPEARNNDPKLKLHKRNLAYNAACILDKSGLILFDQKSESISSTELGRIASNFNCSSATIQKFYASIDENTTDMDLFRIFSLADEFKDINVRRNEEADLKTMLNQVPFPVDNKRSKPREDKVNVLLQVYIFRLNIEGSDLICDMHFIKENAARLSRAIHEIVLLKGYAAIAELSLDFCRKIDLRMTACHTPLRQFSDDLDADIINRLEKKNYHIDELRVLKSDKLTELLRCDHTIGNKVYEMLKHLPKLKIEASLKPMSKTSLKVDLTIVPNFTWSDKYHGSSERFWLFVEDVNQDRLLHYEIIHVRKYMTSRNKKLRITFFVEYLMPSQPFYYLRIFPDRWFGCDHHLPLYLDKLTLPDDPLTMTQLLDIDPARIRSLENPLFERYYANKFKGSDFNQIQTQSFKHLYKSDDDIILLASAGSGKTTCAELAIIHNINIRGTSSKCAYVAPNAQAAQLVYENWESLFKHYGVVQLTGNHRADAARVDDSKKNIIIGDAERWHILSLVRSKKYKKLFNKFQLFIIDDIHRLYSDNNSALEWLCSKIRILTKLNVDSPARIVTLGSPVACADSLRSWLARESGSKEPVLLNYSPNIRPVKLELVINTYNHYDYKMRLLTMQRPAYRLVNHVSRGKPSLIFVSDFHQVLEISEIFKCYSKSEGLGFVFPRTNLDKVHEPTLRKYLKYGIGYLHLGMNPYDWKLVEELFESDQINVIVATVSTCWSIQCRSYLTIIMDTQQYDSVDATDYELTDIIQMAGLTGRPLIDHGCRCVIMCQSSKADLYERFLVKEKPLPIESHLPGNLISYVNYELATDAIEKLNHIYKPYLAHTYFYKRIAINPNYYGIIVPDDKEQKERAFGNFFNNLVNKVALELEKNEFMTMKDSHENPTFIAGLLSKISLEYYINHTTLDRYNKWFDTNSNSLTANYMGLIGLISSNTYEFDKISVKNGELPYLKSLQKRLKIWSDSEGDQIHKRSFKIKLLILSQYQEKIDKREHDVQGELIEDRRFIITMSYRLLMAMVDIAWLKDSFHLAKTAIQLSRKLVPFERSSKPNIDMDISISRDGDQIRIEVTAIREDEPFSFKEFETNFATLSHSMYRDEGWCFLINGKSRLNRNEHDKFVLFKRVKTPGHGKNEYKLDLELTDNAESYIYDLYFMSDFYSTSDDRRVADIDLSCMRAS